MGRYAEWTPNRSELAIHRLKVALRRPLRPLWRAVHWLERSPLLASWWARRAGPDYTGWRVRNLHTIGVLTAGEVGMVAGYELQGRHRRYVVVFEHTDYYTGLPSQYVELIPRSD